MAGFTNYAYRRALRELGGAGLLCTEMISAESLLRRGQGLKSAGHRLWGVRDEPRPLAVQIWDNDEEALAEAARRLAGEWGFSLVDLNFGCPVPRVTRAESGSWLLDDPARIGRLVERVVRACAPTPVTAKIRLGYRRGKITAPEVARAVEDAGAAGLTVHGRIAQDYYRHPADWDAIAQVKTCLRRMPLIGNGDLDSAEKVVTAFRRYGVDGVMIGRAGLKEPWLFRQAASALRGEAPPAEPSLEQQRRMLLRHHQWFVERLGDQRGTIVMRRHACLYASGRRGAPLFRRHIGQCSSTTQFVETVERFFPPE
jgi:tRNA-dihydrouridine synthase B